MLGLVGCASSSPRKADLARDAFVAGDLSVATKTLDELAHKRDRLSDPSALDLAIVELATGDSKSAEQRLRVLRDRFDALPRIAPISEATSMLTDDLSRVYRPAGYEEVMIRVMLSLCSLARDSGDAESYALQAARKQAELAEAAQQRGITGVDKAFQPIAIAPYLRGVLREATHRDYDDAARAYKLVHAVRPQFSTIEADVARAVGGIHSQPGHGALYVIACVGRGPVLQETVAPTTTTALQIASQILGSAKDEDGEIVLPNVASVKVPQVVIPDSNIAAINASLATKHLGTTETLTDVGQLAANQLAAEMPWTIARAVIRRVTKEATVSKASDNIGLEGSAASIFQFAAGSLWSSTEKADTRCWGMLPREIQVLRTELPVGNQTLELTPIGFQNQPISPPRSYNVSIADGRNHYLIVIAPNAAFHVVR